jgi:hypothetical protein
LALIVLDSFKLVKLRSVILAIVGGSAVALACLWINISILNAIDVSTATFARYIAPAVEEVAKATYVIVLLLRKRIGFLVDASIYGFAVGAGFAIVENIHYFRNVSEPLLMLWVIRGFGTAIMHGGATALVGILSKYMSDRFGTNLLMGLPGCVLAILVHSFFNHFSVLSTLGLLILLPVLIGVVFSASERGTRRWLGVRFDTDQELLEMINTGQIAESRVGEYMKSLQTRFPGEVVVDMVCMLRIHLELSIRAKGILLMREAGFEPEPEPGIEAQFTELKYLEKSIGRTGQLAVAPILNMSDRELWQLNMLGKR